jgi:uncharacterized protein YqeY
MAIVEDVNRAITQAMKAKDPQRLVALRMLKTALMNRETSGRRLMKTSAPVVSSLSSAPRFHRAVRQGGPGPADKETAEIAFSKSPPAWRRRSGADRGWRDRNRRPPR